MRDHHAAADGGAEAAEGRAGAGADPCGDARQRGASGAGLRRRAGTAVRRDAARGAGDRGPGGGGRGRWTWAGGPAGGSRGGARAGRGRGWQAASWTS